MPKPAYHHIALACCLLFFSNWSYSQNIEGSITDTLGKPIPFATIKIGSTKQGLIADLHGKFKFRYNSDYGYFTVIHLGYESKRINISISDTTRPLLITLEPSVNTLEDVVILSNNSKIRRILSNAINNRNINNPDKYDWYQCKVYFKTSMDMVMPIDTTRKKDTSKTTKQDDDFLKDQHLFMTETYSRRTWEKPQKLQEEVIATRVSGFKKAIFSWLITDVLPFHSYSDYISLNGRDFYNPISSGTFQRFNFRLEDEILQDKDTLWILSFNPRKDPDQLSGSIYIHSHQFAIAHLLAVNKDTILQREMGMEQQYMLVDGKWFPQQLNYYIDWRNVMNTGIQAYMKGTSLIDSLTFEKKAFDFDRGRTVKIMKGADELPDSTWENVRPAPLTEKEAKSYNILDSMGAKYKFDVFATYLNKLVDGLFPLGMVDLDLKRIYNYNAYERHRLGLGLQTSDKISKWFTLGGWFGYGTRDKEWKYGGFAELYGDDRRDLVLKLAYNKDLRDPGRLQIHKELDKNFLRGFLLNRADQVTSYSASVKKRLGYFEATLGYTEEHIEPKYAYALETEGKTFSNFSTKEVTLQLRYAFAERMAPIFGRYYSAGSKYPIVFTKFTAGKMNNDNNYLQALAALSWRKHINRLGDEKILLIAGKAFSEKPLPLNKLFAGNGFLAEDRSIYVFGGMQTMLPYAYYSDRFLNLYWKHDFDFKLYNAKITKGLGSAPSISIGYNVLWGNLEDTAAHKLTSFTVPDPAYHEGGLMLNRLIKLKFMGMYSLNLNAGYFYHFDGPFDHKKNGRFVIGIGADL